MRGLDRRVERLLVFALLFNRAERVVFTEAFIDRMLEEAARNRRSGRWTLGRVGNVPKSEGGSLPSLALRYSLIPTD